MLKKILLFINLFFLCLAQHSLLAKNKKEVEKTENQKKAEMMNKPEVKEKMINAFASAVEEMLPAKACKELLLGCFKMKEDLCLQELKQETALCMKKIKPDMLEKIHFNENGTDNFDADMWGDKIALCIINPFLQKHKDIQSKEKKCQINEKDFMSLE